MTTGSDTTATFSWSKDDERFQDEFDSREDALAFARREYPGETVWTGRSVPAVLGTPFDVDDLQERIHDMMWDEIGEASENVQTTTEADADWVGMVGEWMDRHAVATVAGSFKVVDVVKHAAEAQL